MCLPTIISVFVDYAVSKYLAAAPSSKRKLTPNYASSVARYYNYSLEFFFEFTNVCFVFICLRSLQPLFMKLAKSNISAQFFVYVLGWYTYFETSQVLFSLCFQ